MKRDNAEMLRFFGYADDPGMDTVNPFKLDKEHAATLTRKQGGYREHNKNAIKEVIEISKDSSKIKSHENWGCERLPLPPTATLTDPCVEEAQERMGLNKKKCIC